MSNQRRGAEEFARLLASRPGARFTHRVYALHWFGAQGDALISRLPRASWRRLWLGLLPGVGPGVARLVTAIDREQPALVVGHGGPTLRHVAVASLASRRAAYVFKSIGMAGDWTRGVAQRRVGALLLARFDGILSVSERARGALAETYGLAPDRVLVIPSGRPALPEPDAATRQRVRGELRLPTDSVVLLWAGALTPDKDPLAALELVARLDMGRAVVTVLVAGAGPLEADARRFVQARGLDGVVRLLGQRDDVPRLLAAADVVLLTSRTEGLPGILIEAGMAGLPSAAFAVGGVPEVVVGGETGLLADGGDMAALAAHLDRLVRDPALRKLLGRAARSRCLRLFELEDVAARYEGFLAELVTGRTT